jgi:hypothetical protein
MFIVWVFFLSQAVLLDHMTIKLIDIICISKLWEVGGLHLSPGFHTQKKYDLDFPDAGSTPLKRSSVDCSGRITLHYSPLCLLFEECHTPCALK